MKTQNSERKGIKQFKTSKWNEINFLKKTEKNLELIWQEAILTNRLQGMEERILGTEDTIKEMDVSV